MPFEIRNYLQQDYEMVRDWGNKQGWNQGVYDHIAFKQLNKGGFWMGVLDGQPVSNLSITEYDQNFAFIGLYIAKPEHRGKGYGYGLWKHALSKVTSKNIALQAALQQQHNYAKSGFKTYHQTIRYMLKGNNLKFVSQHLVQCKQIEFQKLQVYDRQNFPAKRSQFLKKWINLPESKAIAFVKQENIHGYGVLRLSDQGYRIGPLFADTFEVAEQILSNFLGQISNQTKVFIDIPEINLQALKLAKLFEMSPGFVCARMYTNGMPNLPFHKTVYGVTSLEFG